MSKVLTRTQSGFTHYFGLDIVNVVPEFFTGTFNAVAQATGITGQIDGTVPTAVVNAAYYVCTRAGTDAATGTVYQLGHIYKGISGAWVDQGVQDRQRMVPTTGLTGKDVIFSSGVEYTYVKEAGDKMHTMGNVVYDYGKGKWFISGDTVATTPVCYAEAASSTMRFGVGTYNILATKAVGSASVYYTIDSLVQFRQDPRTVTWKLLASLADAQAASVPAPITAFKVVFSDTTPGLVAVVVN